jgi:hypothetical protein
VSAVTEVERLAGEAGVRCTRERLVRRYASANLGRSGGRAPRRCCAQVDRPGVSARPVCVLRIGRRHGDLTDRRSGAEVELERLRVAERAGPARRRVPRPRPMSSDRPSSPATGGRHRTNARLVVRRRSVDNDGTNAAATTATAINSFLIPLLLVVLTRPWQRRRPRSYRSRDKPATGISQRRGMTCPAKDN